MADASMIEQSHAGVIGRFQATIRELATGFAKYRLYRRTLAELQGLSGRELADLGLNRTEIRRVAYFAAYQ